MRIIAFSDTHGKRGAVAKLFKETADRTDIYIFCGDGIYDVQYALKDRPKINIIMAKGNCDFSGAPDIASCEAEGKKILCTHGHLQGIRYDTAGLERLAYQNKASLIIYGHTHCRECLYKNGVYYVNPGSMALPRDGYPPSYAAIDVLPQGILVSSVDFY